ncbi:MAG: hypothetical protein ACQKBY_01920 [Verrucomicrobiales bacterium]
MKKLMTTIAPAAVALGALFLASCGSPQPPTIIESPEVHNITIQEKPTPKPKPRPKPQYEKPAEAFRAVY